MSSDGSTMTLDKSPETLDGGKPSSHTSDNLKEFGTQSQHHQHSTSSSEVRFHAPQNVVPEKTISIYY
jgi:hypothetical protein